MGYLSLCLVTLTCRCLVRSWFRPCPPLFPPFPPYFPGDLLPLALREGGRGGGGLGLAAVGCHLRKMHGCLARAMASAQMPACSRKASSQLAIFLSESSVRSSQLKCKSQRKIEGQQLKGKNVSALFTLFLIFFTLFRALFCPPSCG